MSQPTGRPRRRTGRAAAILVAGGLLALADGSRAQPQAAGERTPANVGTGAGTGDTSNDARPAPVDGRAGLEPLLRLRGEREEPLTIESEQVELTAMPDDGRLVRFERDVRVHQGALELRARELEAFYPPQESEPSRITARGDVQIDQPGQRAFCDEAEYRRAEDRLICRGHARLVQGCDVVRGDSIELDLSQNRARVVGAARVVIGPREGADDCPNVSTQGADGP